MGITSYKIEIAIMAHFSLIENYRRLWNSFRIHDNVISRNLARPAFQIRESEVGHGKLDY